MDQLRLKSDLKLYTMGGNVVNLQQSMGNWRIISYAYSNN